MAIYPPLRQAFVGCFYPFPPVTFIPLTPPTVAAIMNFSISEERERVQRRMQGFDWQKSNVWQCLTQSYGEKLNQDELISIADLVATKLKIKLDRDARRRKAVMIKWFEEHWESIQTLLPQVALD
jgi:RNA polymerase-interacting CarD/CdnL/TRCF family regulator